MTAEQLIIGNKYVPFQKTIGDDFSDSKFVVQGLDFLYYQGTNESGNHMFSKSETALTGAYYNPEDVYQYIEEHNGIRRGMTVTITDYGYTYSTHEVKFKQLLFKDKERNDSWSNGTEGVVFAISTSDNRDLIQFAVRHSSGKECLIGAEGVRLVDDVVDCLPDKWAIEINLNNIDELMNWRDFRINQYEGYILSDIPEGESHSLPFNRGFYVRTLEDYREYKVITDEQFFKQIINKPMPQTTQEQQTTQEPQVQEETKQYPKTPQGLYQMTIDLLALEVGDTVKITHKVPGHYNGWDNSWSDSMDNYIGKVSTIEEIYETGFVLKDCSYYKFPIYSLELVERKKQARTHTLSFTESQGRMTDGDEYVYFDNPVTKLSGNDVFWLVQLLTMAGVDKKNSVSTSVH